MVFRNHVNLGRLQADYRTRDSGSLQFGIQRRPSIVGLLACGVPIGYDGAPHCPPPRGLGSERSSGVTRRGLWPDTASSIWRPPHRSPPDISRISPPSGLPSGQNCSADRSGSSSMPSGVTQRLKPVPQPHLTRTRQPESVWGPISAFRSPHFHGLGRGRVTHCTCP